MITILKQMRIKKIKPGAKDYPKNLDALGDFARILYIRGTLVEHDRRAVAIVGSRRMSEHGKEMAWKYASELAKNKITIVSGLARGVDTIAHKAALSAGGRTIAVLGSGLDVIYPPENRGLAEAIVKNGALISEFPSGTKPLQKNFLARNRIVAALSLAVLVVEGAKRSGTYSIANHAANLGREVFAIPGKPSEPLSAMPNFLIENGAQIARAPEDILQIL